MVFSVYEVVRVACLSHRKQTNYATDKPRERPRKTLKAMQERMNLYSQGKQLQFFFSFTILTRCFKAKEPKNDRLI